MDAEKQVRKIQNVSRAQFTRCHQYFTGNKTPPTNRFVRDISTLAAWMDEAREMIDRWSQLSEAGVDQRRHDYLQAVVSTVSAENNSLY